MGHVIKALVFYEKPWWRERGLSGEGVSDGAIRLTFDASYPEKDIWALVGFYLGDSALEWSDRTEEERKEGIVAHFVSVFGSDAAKPIGYLENNWCAERYSRGAYMSIPAPNILTRVGPAIREPFGRIHFAGTETSTEWSGYMEGAIAAAERVTEEILEHPAGISDYGTLGFNRGLRQPGPLDLSLGNKFSWTHSTLIIATLAGTAALLYKGKVTFH